RAAVLRGAEQLLLELRLRDPGARHPYELRPATRAELVNGARDELLADAALAGDEHADSGSGQQHDTVPQSHGGRTRTHDHRRFNDRHAVTSRVNVGRPLPHAPQSHRDNAPLLTIVSTVQGPCRPGRAVVSG